MRYLLPKLFWIIFGIGGFFLAHWLLTIAGLEHGRWESILMFLPGILLFVGGLILRSIGNKAYGIFILSGLAVVFGIVVLITG